MINVGVIGLGMMGRTHLNVYEQREDVKIAAISDLNPRRLSGEERAAGNIEGQAAGGDRFPDAARHDEGKKLIADDRVELVDICLPTPLHLEYATAALDAGKHVLVEKPVCRTAAEAFELADRAEAAEQQGLYTMPAMCMRFWPAWSWLKEAIERQTYGKVLAASFRRVAQHPGGPFYSDGPASGGAALDLHIHDVDFILYCFGAPRRVLSSGYRRITTEIDHVFSQYDYGGEPIVSVEGGWSMAPGFGFRMQYTVNFERATASFEIGAEPELTLYEEGKPPVPVHVSPGLGYEHEIDYFLRCVRDRTPPRTVTVRQAAESVRLVEAECRSIETGEAAKL